MKKNLIQKSSLVLTDILALALSLFLAKLSLSIIRPGIDNIDFSTFGVAKSVGLVIIAVFWYQEQYVKRRPIWEELRLLYQTIFVFAFLHLGISYLVSHHVVKFLVVLFWLYLLIMIPLLRWCIKYVLDRLNLWSRDIYIVGVGNNAVSCAKLLMNGWLLGYKVIGFISLESVEKDQIKIKDKSYPIYSYLEILDNDVGDAEAVFALSSAQIIKFTHLVNIFQSKFTFVSIVPDVGGLPLYGVKLEHFFGSDQLFLRLQNNLGRRVNRIVKRTFDIILGALMLFLLSPLMLIIMICIKLSAKQAVFFYHNRVGRNGKMFACIKFQSMYSNGAELLEHLLKTDEVAKKEWDRDFKLKNDPRVTPIGRFLRKTSLDELPQLFNVLKGQMSLVGPRPIVLDEVKKYNQEIYYYKSVRPGITGLWQISGRNDVDYEERVRLDVWYVKNWSLWYDFVILFKTILVVLTRSGAY